jgi:D-psicose/D-tagatose/L-ribulose 3-epimerase
MRYGMNMLLWTTELTDAHLPILDRLRAIGYDTIEVPVFETSDPDGYARLGERLRAMQLAPLAIAALGPEANPIADDPAVRSAARAKLAQVLECTVALGAPILSGPYHSALGVFSGATPTPAEFDRAAEALIPLAEAARAGNIRLAIEPLNRFECYLLNDAATAAAFAGRLGHGAGILYDTFHAHIEEKDSAAAIRAAGADIALVHVSENDRSTPGLGQVRWAENFAALKAAGYAGPLVVEAFGLALPALAAATRIWRRMFDDEFALAERALSFMRGQWEAASG